jgi:TP901 family phage tail tape measure protein
MSVRSVIVRLEAEVAGYVAGMGKAAQSTKAAADAAEAAAKKIDQAQDTAAKSTDKSTEANKKHGTSGEESAKGSEKSAEASKKDAEYKKKQSDAADTAGTAMLTFGTVSVAALGASAKAAMDWETAWTGVTKTVNGTPAEMAELESGLRSLAKTLPSTHEEIAGVAEAAGQLGVKREDVLAFTKTMIDLGTSTNLTADEAATGIAQIANIMGTSGADIDNFGATLVALGNAGASTEKDILSMAQRIAGAGKLVGASEADVLALSNTLASMGVNAELGGGVSTRALLKMYSAVESGGPKLDAFAKTAGKSSEEFAKAFRESPVAALDMVTKGLSRTKAEGGNVVAVLGTLGLKGTEEMQVMLALAGAGDLLSDSLKLGSKAWEENTALINEASKRYETTESKVKIAWNNIKDAAIDAGAVMLPVIQGIAENVNNLAQGFGSLPAPLQGAVTGLAGVVGVGALVAGGIMTLLPKVTAAHEAFQTLNTRADGSTRGLGKLAGAAGVAAGAFIGFEIIKSVHNSMQEAGVSTEEMTQNLLKLAQQGDSMDKAFSDIGTKEFEGDIKSAGEALKKVTQQDFNTAVESFGATALGIDNGVAKITKAFEKSDQAIAGAATSGNLEIAAKGFRAIADSAKDQGISVEDTAKHFPVYMDALRKMASDSHVVVEDTDLLKWAMGEVPPVMKAAADGGDKVAQALIGEAGAAERAAAVTKEIAKQLADVGLNAEGAVVDIDKFGASLFAAGLLSLSASDANIALEAAIDKMTQSVIDNGTTLDINTEKGRANQSAYNDIAKAGITAAEARAKETLASQGSAAAQEELQAAMHTSYDDLVAAAAQLGITGDEADTMARKALGIPKEVNINTWIADHASKTLEDIKGKADALDGKVVDLWAYTHDITLKKTIQDPGGMGSSIGGRANGSLGGGEADGGALVKRAGGGPIRGPGTHTSDEVPFMGSDGEHVLDAGDVIKMGGQQAVYKFRSQLRSGQFDGLAAGGGVGTRTASTHLMAYNPVATPVAATGGTFEGNLFLDSGEFLGKVRGVARQEASGAIASTDGNSRFLRKGPRG